MAGLLGDSWDDPRTQATLQLAAGLLGGGNFGQALGRGLGGYQQAMGAAEEAKTRKEMMDWKRQEMEAAKAQQAEAERVRMMQRDWLTRQNPQAQATQQALIGGGGPTQANASNMQPVDPTRQMMWDAANSGILSPGDYLKQLTPKEEEAFTLGEGQVRYKGNKMVAQGPDKAPDSPSAVREYEYAKSQGYQGNFIDFQLAQKRAGAPSVAVNTADPTAVAKAAMQFQNDFRGATKGSYARATAYNSMLEASKNPSPKGDLTMVYSFVKALDPESVVREGEISLLNANRNVPDQIKGYAQRLATGQSLLPHERKDLMNQARNLSFTDYTRSRNDIKAYRDNAGRLGLDPELYAPDPYAGVDFGPRVTPNAPTMPNLPPAAQHKGRTIRDTETGRVLRSDGMTWREQ